MTDPEDRQDSSELDELNEQLSASIDRCRFLLDDCRSKLAANSNNKNAAEEDEVRQRTS